MTTIATHDYRKHEWGAGPWLSEPDRVEFEHAGLPCLLLRNHAGAWCGYAAVPSCHPWHRIEYSSCTQDCPESYCAHSPECRIDVHGGLTYSDACQGEICHVPKPGESDDVWWFGFDCAHYGDVSPRFDTGLFRNPDGTYKDVAYVRAETERLAEQLAAIGPVREAP